MSIVNRKQITHGLRLVGAISMLALWESAAMANGIYRDGVGARSIAMGGADTAWAEDPLGALGANPAGLGFQSSAEFDLGLFGGSASGEFEKQNISNGSLDQTLSVLPESAFAMPIGKLPVTVGLAVVPDALMSANWHYTDPPSSSGVSYGYQGNKSVIGVLRTALGVGVALGDHWSLGGSVGILYNQNELVTPYIFQTQPVLKGAKTLLNLTTSGWGVNGQFGVLFRPIDTLQFGLTYTTESTVDSTGDASGNASAQFGNPPGGVPFHYDAEVDNTFPQMISGGGSWKFLPDWRLALQVDWIDWAGAFSTLPVKLSNGNNPAVNGIVGSSSMQDNVPLNWKDEFVFRGGLEYAVTTNLMLRGGYSYGESPVPNETLTPLTAAITEGAVSAGIGWHWSRYHVDFAYEYDLPVERSIGTSSLQAGEYSNSSIKVAIQSLALTAGVKF